MNKLDTLEIRFTHNNVENIIYPVVVSDKNEMILIDCGYPHFLPLMHYSLRNKCFFYMYSGKVKWE